MDISFTLLYQFFPVLLRLQLQCF